MAGRADRAARLLFSGAWGRGIARRLNQEEETVILQRFRESPIVVSRVRSRQSPAM
jgi:hypothetical protein